MDNKWTERDWKWIVWILVGIIVLFFSYGLWDKEKSLQDLISIGSGLVSIALAVVAIIISVSESIKTSIKEQDVGVGLKSILETVKKMQNMIDENNSKTDSLISSNEKLYLEFYNITHTNSAVNTGESSQSKSSGIKDEVISSGDGLEKSNKVNEDASPTNKVNQYKVSRGDIYFAELGSVQGSEQAGTRPVIIIQNDIANRFSATFTVIPITTQISKAKLPTHVELNIDGEEYVAMVEQMRVITRDRLIKNIGKINEQTLSKLEQSIMIQFGLIEI
jgi:mRNA-degrading endonuclease toxin of MazEF toxin-antitoxin module